MNAWAGVVARCDYTYAASCDDDLDIVQGDLIRCLEPVNSEWVRGSVDNRRGIFPKNFVSLTGRDAARVSFDYTGNEKEDANVRAGTRCIITKYLNRDWANVYVEKGKHGMIPLNHLSNIVIKPLEPTDPIHAVFNRIPKDIPDKHVSSKFEMVSNAPIKNDIESTDNCNSNESISSNSLNNSLNSSTSSSDRSASLNNEALLHNEKNAKKRINIITELLDTERKYCNDLDICLKVFFPPPTGHLASKFDHSSLFGNLRPLYNFSKRLNAELQSTAQKSVHNQLFGSCFLKFADELLESYSPFCKDCGDITESIAKYNEDPDVKKYFTSKIEEMKQLGSNEFSVISLLSKPGQRVMKYPLLVKELSSTTPSDHPDHQDLVLAHIRLMEIITSFNELKRTKELMEKYRTQDSSFTNKLSKISFHTLRKKSNRWSQSISRTVFTSSQIKDEEFETLHSQLKIQHKMVKQLITRCLSTITLMSEYLESFRYLVDTMKQIQDPAVPTSTVRTLINAVKVLSSLTQDFSIEMESKMISPLNILLPMFDGPFKLIAKREHKLLDFERLTAKYEKSSNATHEQKEEYSVAKGNYVALNSQLKQELPRFLRVSQSVLHDLLIVYGRVRHRLHSAFSQDISRSIRFKDDIKQRWRPQYVAVCEAMISNVSNFPRDYLDWMNSSKRKASTDVLKRRRCASQSSSSPNERRALEQSSKARRKILDTFPASDIYQVNKRFVVVEDLDLSVNVGSLLGVKKRSNPMGRKDIWFVSNAISDGFVPSNILTLYKQANAMNGSQSDMRSLVNNADNPTGSLANIDLGASNQSNCEQMVTLSHSARRNTHGTLPRDSATSSNQNEHMPLKQRRSLVAGLALKSNVIICPDARDVSRKAQFSSSQSPSTPQTPNTPNPIEQYSVKWAYSAATDLEVSLSENDIVHVLRQSDTEGNSEWWLVQHSTLGTKGYYPANYLQKC